MSFRRPPWMFSGKSWLVYFEIVYMKKKETTTFVDLAKLASLQQHEQSKAISICRYCFWHYLTMVSTGMFREVKQRISEPTRSEDCCLVFKWQLEWESGFGKVYMRVKCIYILGVLLENAIWKKPWRHFLTAFPLKWRGSHSSSTLQHQRPEFLLNSTFQRGMAPVLRPWPNKERVIFPKLVQMW